MRNCPNCGSSAQVRLIESDVVSYYTDDDNNNLVVVHKEYMCGCGEYFTTAQIFAEIDNEDIINSWNANKED